MSHISKSGNDVAKILLNISILPLVSFSDAAEFSMLELSFPF